MPPIRGRKADATSATGPGMRPNTIGVPERELAELMDMLDERGAGHDCNVKRLHARWPFRKTSLRLTLEHPGGSRAVFQVACRNLSRGGTGVLHNAFVHTGTPCALELPKLDGQSEAIKSSVVRCTHRRGVVHELGVRFDEPIQLSDFVELDPLMGWSSFEKVDPSRLAGTLIVLSESELDHRILAHYLSDTQLKIKSFRSAPEIGALDRGAGDVAVIDLGVSGARELFAAVRDKAIASAAVAIGPDASTATRMLLQAVAADGFVFKPLSSDRLLSVLADCLLGGDAVQIDPSLAGEGSGALVKGCIEQLQSCAAEIREAIAADDPMRVYAICQHIKAIAMPIGLRPIAKLADQTSTSVAQTMSAAESAAKLQELARACERVRVAGGSAS